jgi:PPOX class probable F420-dependent enzyme
MSEMTTTELESYLAEARIADLVTLHKDGSPHIAPVWYQSQPGELFVMAHTSSVKVRNIRHDPRVAISIPKPDYPYQYAVIEGTAKVANRMVNKMIMGISIHYYGPENGEALARELIAEGSMVLIKISPTRTLTWIDD